METVTMERKTTSNLFISTDELLKHWQGHRKLTRKMIEAFPEDKLFKYSVGGMRPFSALVMEMLAMAVPGLKGLLTGKWENWSENNAPSTKEELLTLWDDATEQMNAIWPQIPAERFQETDTAFGQWQGTGYYFIFYFIDNEIHHRGQAYVYLRSLGVEPPAFWDR